LNVIKEKKAKEKGKKLGMLRRVHVSIEMPAVREVQRVYSSIILVHFYHVDYFPCTSNKKAFLSFQYHFNSKYKFNLFYPVS
jgi:hypothetical protein